MKPYSSFVSPLYNNIKCREKTEWNNFWIDQANQSDSDKRILLVGDSTARMIRSTLAKYLNCPVDLIASSYALHDILYENQLEFFFKDSSYRYDTIFVQVGVHNLIGLGGDWYQDDDYTRFSDSLAGLVHYLQQYSSNVVVETILISVLHKPKYVKYLSEMGCLKWFRWLFPDKPDKERNVIEMKKNQIIRELVSREHFSFLDIECMLNKLNYIRYDHIHYEKDALFPICKAMGNYIIKK